MNRKPPPEARKILNQILTKMKKLKPTVLLDAGHRESTPGKEFTFKDGTKFKEWEFNQDIVSRIAEQLIQNNVSYEYLPNDYNDIPLYKRVEWANKFDNCFLLSIHSNADKKESNANGFEVWTSPGETLSDKIAKIFYEEADNSEMWNYMRKGFTRGPDKEAKFTILTDTKCPAVLTENGFYTNYSDVNNILNTEQGRQRIANYHVNAILRILDEVYV